MPLGGAFVVGGLTLWKRKTVVSTGIPLDALPDRRFGEVFAEQNTGESP